MLQKKLTVRPTQSWRLTNLQTEIALKIVLQKVIEARNSSFDLSFFTTQ